MKNSSILLADPILIRLICNTILSPLSLDLSDVLNFMCSALLLPVTSYNDKSMTTSPVCIHFLKTNFVSRVRITSLHY